MFQSLNLFKAINCPYFNNSQNNNLTTCERPHCQFKHTRVPNTSSASSNVSVSEIKDVDPVDESTDVKIVTPKINDKESSEKLAKLPDILENLSNALQSVQKLITTSNLETNLAQLATSSTTPDSNKINNSLESLASVISSLSSSNTKEKQEIKSPINSLKRQQLNAPAYNPTPIKDLKNIKKACTSDEEDNLSIKKRKLTASSIDNVTVKQSLENSSNSLSTSTKSVKSDKKSTSAKTSGKEVATESSAKIDMVTFSKLPLSQQVQRRYEMLNKTPPTPMSLAESRLKKIQGSLGATKSTVSQKTGTIVPQKAPRLILDNTNKIPLAMRQRYLMVIFDNGRASFATLEKACEKAAEQEKSIYDRAKNKTIYTNLAANLIRVLRNAQQTSSTATSSNKKASNSSMSLNNVKKPQIQTQSHEAMLSGPKANRCTYSINRVKQISVKDLSARELYRMFYTYIMTEKQLEENSFPKWMQSDSKTKLAMIPNYHEKNSDKTNKLEEAKKIHAQKQALKNEPSILTKNCKRCNRTFILSSKDLSYLSANSECIHHWGKLRNVRVDKSVVQKYSCCNGGATESGCEVGKHVYDGENDGNGTGLNMAGYVETKESNSSEKQKIAENIYAIDCEMCYTTRGLEVTRVSVVDIKEKEIYESLVKPETQILDYNTRWSGLTEKMLRNCNKTLKQVQSELLKIFDRDTILLGHSLESDFKALKLIHKNVIDTSVVFPHKLGLPYKRALRNLMSEHLQKIIQEDASGHDSKEDANACVQLMIWKINEDLKNSKKLANILEASRSASVQISTVKSKSTNISTASPRKF